VDEKALRTKVEEVRPLSLFSFVFFSLLIFVVLSSHFSFRLLA